MTADNYELLKLFYTRLTAEDFTKRAEDKAEAQGMMYAMGELMEELKHSGRAIIERGKQ